MFWERYSNYIYNPAVYMHGDKHVFNSYFEHSNNDYKRTLHTSTLATPFPSRLLCHSRQPASPGPKTPHPYLLVEYLLSVKYFNVQMLKFVIKSNSCKFVEVGKSNL